MQNILNVKAFFALFLVTFSFTSCSDYLDREPMSEYLSSDFYNNEGAIKQGATACYALLMEVAVIFLCLYYGICILLLELSVLIIVLWEWEI